MTTYNAEAVEISYASEALRALIASGVDISTMTDDELSEAVGGDDGWFAVEVIAAARGVVTSTETRIKMDPDRPITDYVGLPATFVTYEGEPIPGVTEIGYDGALIVRFANGRWGRANAYWEK